MEHAPTAAALSAAEQSAGAGKSFSIPLAVFSALGIAVALTVGAYTGLCAFLASSNTIWPGISILGQEVGGMSVDRAAETLAGVIPTLNADLYLYEEGTKPAVHAGEPDYSIPLSDLGLTLDPYKTARAAYEINVGNTPFFNLGWQFLTG
ncbi:MAG: hypothetical protein IJT94_16050, partial [Oscillibacter sp.]|nr:hypothetical protein [Oscillibacter sp.]